MRKLTEEDNRNIVISHYLDNSNENIQRLCKQYNVTKKTLYNVINKEESKRYIQTYKPNYTKKLDTIIEKALERLIQQVNQEDIKALDLTKIIGILYDKIRLEEGLSTSNNSININIKVEK